MFWIKCIHYQGDGWTIEPGEKRWISDTGRRDAQGQRVFRRDGVPWGEPSWDVGDQVGLYYGGTLKVPVLAEVTSAPEFNPDFVHAESHGQEADAGERWPWVTWVKGLYSRAPDKAPSLDDLEIPHRKVMRRTRFVISPAEHRRLVHRLS